MEQREGFGVSGEDYKRLYKLAKRGKRIGVHIQHKSGRLRFFILNNQMMCQSRTKDNKLVTKEVVDISTLPQRPAVSNDIIRQALRHEYPDMGQEEVDLNADIIHESRGTIERLQQAGLTQQQAELLVKKTLNDEFITECKDIIVSAE